MAIKRGAFKRDLFSEKFDSASKRRYRKAPQLKKRDERFYIFFKGFAEAIYYAKNSKNCNVLFKAPDLKKKSILYNLLLGTENLAFFYLLPSSQMIDNNYYLVVSLWIEDPAFVKALKRNLPFSKPYHSNLEIVGVVEDAFFKKKPRYRKPSLCVNKSNFYWFFA